MTTNKSLTDSLPTVDMKLMVQTEKDIRDAYNKITSPNYPALKDICQGIYENITQTLNDSQQFNISIQAGIDTLVTQLNRLNDRIIPLEEQKKILAQIQRFRDAGDKYIRDYLEKPTSGSASLNKAVGNIEFADIKQQLTGGATKLQKKLESVNENIEKYTQKYEQAQKEWDALNQTVQFMSTSGLEDYTSDQTPTAANLADMAAKGAAVPELEILKLALDIYSKLVDVIGYGFSYNKMADARNSKYKEMEGYRQEKENYQQQKHDIEIDQQSIDRISLIERERFTFTGEVTKLAQAYTIYNDEITKLMSQDINYNNIISSLGEMETYLKALISDANP
ncbi:MAG: alpha-xenorhabdolysin family binary toxin subunit B [Prochloron sp. SP5CPC1]|nr:alpha-xenorhabdolysin family binary toxin subunit B [Candidatus Paraprochloron terpiosi SP5CPC1]